MIEQGETLFRNITLSMRYGLVAGYVLRTTKKKPTQMFVHTY